MRGAGGPPAVPPLPSGERQRRARRAGVWRGATEAVAASPGKPLTPGGQALGSTRQDPCCPFTSEPGSWTLPAFSFLRSVVWGYACAPCLYY